MPSTGDESSEYEAAGHAFGIDTKGRQTLKEAAAKLWVVLALRSARVPVVGNWHKFLTL